MLTVFVCCSNASFEKDNDARSGSKGVKDKNISKQDILKAIEAKVDCPLVLHGGSNNPDREIGEAEFET